MQSGLGTLTRPAKAQLQRNIPNKTDAEEEKEDDAADLLMRRHQEYQEQKRYAPPHHLNTAA